jgi:hypothetical protein
MNKILPIFAIALVTFNACMFDGPRIKGNGHVVTENKQFGDISGVELDASFDVYLTEGTAAGVKIEAEENIIPYIEFRVENGVLNIDTKDGVNLRTEKPVKIFITAPRYHKIECDGSGNIIGQTKITNDEKLRIGVSGSGDLKLDVDAPEIHTNLSGSGEINLAGATKKFNGEVTGSGDINAMNLMSEESDLQITGSGNIDIYSSVKLVATITGSGDVRYKGDAATNSTITGSGTVKKVN